MMNNLRNFLNRCAVKLIKVAYRLESYARRLAEKTEDLETAKRRRRESKWYRDRGDQTLRITYPLDPNSVVFDVGGYHGDWARDIYCLYGSQIYIFEPVPAFVDLITQKFGKNPSIHIEPYGLSSKNASAQIYLAEGGTSTIKQSGESIQIRLACMGDFLKKKEINHINLLKVNIEGGEYELLEHLIDIGFVSRINDIQVQFHNFIPDGKSRMKNIQQKLSKTHYLTYSYPWTWENWRLKE